MFCDKCDRKISIGDIFYTEIKNYDCICSGCITEVVEEILSDSERVAEPSDLEVYGYGD